MSVSRIPDISTEKQLRDLNAKSNVDDIMCTLHGIPILKVKSMISCVTIHGVTDSIHGVADAIFGFDDAKY